MFVSMLGYWKGLIFFLWFDWYQVLYKSESFRSDSWYSFIFELGPMRGIYMYIYSKAQQMGANEMIFFFDVFPIEKTIFFDSRNTCLLWLPSCYHWFIGLFKGFLGFDRKFCNGRLQKHKKKKERKKDSWHSI